MTITQQTTHTDDCALKDTHHGPCDSLRGVGRTEDMLGQALSALRDLLVVTRLLKRQPATTGPQLVDQAESVITELRDDAFHGFVTVRRVDLQAVLDLLDADQQMSVPTDLLAEFHCWPVRSHREVAWKPGDACHACGSTNTGEDPERGGYCNGCGACDADDD